MPVDDEGSKLWWRHERVRLRCMARHRLTRTEVRAWHRRFANHKGRAKNYGIRFSLSFEDWLRLWFNSGHAHERGSNRGQYVMARFGDVGPYALGNVKIILTEQNRAEERPGNMGRYPRTEEHNRKIGETRKALGLTATNLAELHEGNRGNKYRLGKLHTAATKAKMSASMQERWRLRKEVGLASR